MTNLRISGWLVFALFASDALAQIGYPGGGYPPGGRYPGGGGIPGPGIPMPGRGKKSKTTTAKEEESRQLITVTGILRMLNDKQVVVEAKDSRVINLKRSEKTKFMKDGDDMKPSFFKPGDHVLIEANQDKEGFFYAVNVIFEKEGSASERAEASRPVQVSTQASESSDDDDRPRMRRADSPAEPAAPTPPVAVEPPPAPVPPPAPRVAADQPLPPAAPDPDDPGPPVLRRGIPVNTKRPVRVEIASAKAPVSAPAPPAPPVAPAPRRPDPPQPDAAPLDPLIEKAKDVAESFTETLPNYICQQFTARFVSTSHIVSWQAQDVVSAEVVYENGRESYRNLAINGKAIKKGMEELSGSWSTGEFGTLLRDLFSPATAAKFRYRKDSIIAGMPAGLYDFQVEREGSHWRVQVASQSVFPAYKGSVWIEKKNGRVLRIEMQTRNMPSEFPLDKVETAADYEYVRIGGTQQFLLPVHSETLSCQRGTNTCSRNAIDFRNYKKYSGEATILFDK